MRLPVKTDPPHVLKPSSTINYHPVLDKLTRRMS